MSQDGLTLDEMFPIVIQHQEAQFWTLRSKITKIDDRLQKLAYSLLNTQNLSSS